MRALYRSDTVTYSDSLGYTSRQGSAWHVVGVDQTETQLTVSPEQPRPDQPVTLTARVLDRASLQTAVTGAVRFELDGVAVGGPIALEPPLEGTTGATARLTLPAPSPGSHAVTAVYTSDRSLFETSSTTMNLSVARREARVKGSVLPDPSVAGRDAIVTAIISAEEPSGHVPTGTVEFAEDDGTPIGDPEPIGVDGRRR